MKKTEIYKKGMQDAMQPFSEKVNEQAATLHHIREHIDGFESDIIDCIEWNIDNPAELIRMLKEKHANRNSIKQFRVSIIYEGKENYSFADALRKDLNNQKNTCEILDYVRFTKHVSSLVDYRIYIGNPEKVKEENCQVLYKAYGMSILQTHSSYVVTYDPKHNFTEGDKEVFISYYESVINKSLEKSKAAEKALKSRKKRKLLNPEGSAPKGTYAAMDTLTNSLDFWADKPSWMSFILGLPSMLITFVAMVCLIPVGIGELALRETVENLREANFDNNFVADAQRQILEVKLVDLFMHEQMRDLYDNDNTEHTNPIQVAQHPHVSDYAVSSDVKKVSEQQKENDPTLSTTDAEIRCIIKETERLSEPYSPLVRIHGTVLNGIPARGSCCLLDGQDDVYKIMFFDLSGDHKHRSAGDNVTFTLKKL